MGLPMVLTWSLEYTWRMTTDWVSEMVPVIRGPSRCQRPCVDWEQADTGSKHNNRAGGDGATTRPGAVEKNTSISINNVDIQSSIVEW